MKKGVQRAVTVCLASAILTMPISLSTTVFANSLDEIITEDEYAEDEYAEDEYAEDEYAEDEYAEDEYSEDGYNDEESSGSSGSSERGNFSNGDGNNGALNDINGAVKIDASEKANEVNDKISGILSPIIIVMAYVITAGLVFRTIADIMYITLPFTRGLLSGGRDQMQQSAGSFGGGGYGGGYGGYGRGYGGGMGMGMGAQQQAPSKLCFVSEEAMKAVQMCTAQSQGGGMGMGMGMGAQQQPAAGQSPLKIYMKDMLVILILTPILLVLAVSGVLVNLGFYLGDILTSGIVNIVDSF